MQREFILKTGRRTYFFDLLESKKDKTFLNITESKRIVEGYKRSNILVSEENLDEFINQLQEVQKHLVKKPDEKSSVINEIRKKYPNAYNKWDEKQDELLTKLFCEKHSAAEIGKAMLRQPSAIRSRIKKLELREIYD